MDDNNTMSLNTERKPGGLYRNIKMSVKTADKLILIGITVLIACMIFAVSHAGFTVTFNTDGGSQIDNQRLCTVSLLILKKTPLKRAIPLPGWYLDKDCTEQFDVNKDTVSDSLTLYSGWEKK